MPAGDQRVGDHGAGSERYVALRRDASAENCDFHDLCFPEGLIENDKCIVLENIGKHDGECKKGFKLNKLTLGFVI